MQYTKTKFTLPASGKKTSDKNWDRAFLTEQEFSAKYGETLEVEMVGHEFDIRTKV